MKKLKYVILLVLTSVSCTKVELTEEDSQLFITGKAISELPCPTGEDSKYGSKKKYKEGFDSYSLHYIFDAKNADVPCKIRAFTRVGVTQSRSQAEEDYNRTLAGAKVGINVSGANLIENNGFYSYGDKSDFYIIQYNGKNVGVYFITLISNNTYALNISPIEFDSTERFRNMIEPRLRKLGDYGV